MKKIEKILKEDLKENKDAIDAIVDSYVSSLQVFRSAEEDKISTANLNIQKAMTNLTNADSQDIINEIYSNLCAIDEANDNLDKLDQIKGFLFEEIKERTEVKCLKKK